MTGMRATVFKRTACFGLALLMAVLPVSALAEADTADLERSETVYVTASAAGEPQSILSSVYICLLYTSDAADEL